VNVEQQNTPKTSANSAEVLPFNPIPFKQRGRRKTIISPKAESVEMHVKKPGTNSVLISAIAKAFYWAHLINNGVVKSGSEIAQKEGVEVSSVNELLRLTLLDPSIIESILTGTQPAALNTRHPLPIDWSSQRALISGLTHGVHNGVPSLPSGTCVSYS
jgi:hypothetical protein